MADKHPMLSVRGLRKNYGGVPALQGVDFDVPAGQVCGLIGPNGSGKSTLFDCCTGLQKSDGGQVLLDGVDISGWPMHRIAREGRLLRSFQKTVVFQSMNSEDNLILAGQMARFPGVASTFSLGGASRARTRVLRERARELIEISGLSRVAHLPAGQMSGGQQKLLEVISTGAWQLLALYYLVVLALRWELPAQSKRLWWGQPNSTMVPITY